ncbi:MAG: Mrp/NBP35 family ATP-binding protein [Ilumatobacteraceae bacterium]|nr:Mrp/NBP35 family ATP-binding protein [Ilumatobacteraceae bacterium]
MESAPNKNPSDGAPSGALPTADAVRNLLRAVIDPELGDNVVDLGMVGDVGVGADGVVTIGFKLTIKGCPLRAQLKKDIESRLQVHPAVTKVVIDWGEMTADERSAVMTRARWNASENATETAVPLGARVLAIASGKGGVGKSSVTVNLAAALAMRGATVGVLDADIWGFSIPRMLGMPDRLQAERVDGRDKPMILPNERRVGRGLLKVVSTGMLVDDESTALMWRGLMLTKAVEQFLNDVHWGELDYLLIDMPPGTGDVQMGLARMLPRTDLVIVTTPAISAQKVAIRAADMARRSFLRVAGVIENMSTFRCEHGESYPLFGVGGGQALADEIGVELLGQVPIEPTVAAGGDAGEPVALHGTGEASRIFNEIAARLAEQTVTLEAMSGCSARDETDGVAVSIRPRS